MSLPTRPGRDAVLEFGWLRAHRWLLLRRVTQVGVMLLFLAGPWFGLWIIKGNLSSSLLLETIPLSDPFVLAQSVFAGHGLETTALLGVLIVAGFYFLVGGRAYCSWVCPVNMVTDTAGWLRTRLGIRGGVQISRKTRYWMLAMTAVVAAISGSLAWELVNPVSITHRAIIFGIGAAWIAIPAVFLFDLFVSRRGWCGHLCPMGAFYGLLGTHSPLRISATHRERCNDCMDCFVVCPEPQVISPALRGAAAGRTPVITSANCTNCGRCVDVCAPGVFEFRLRYRQPDSSSPQFNTVTASVGQAPMHAPQPVQTSGSSKGWGGARSRG